MPKKQPTPPNEKIVYSYDRETKEYIGEYSCQKDPLKEGSFLMPADATATPPPEITLFQKACFENGAWVKKPDYRGRKVVVLESQTILEINELGALPEGATLLNIDEEQELYAGKHARVGKDGKLEFFTPPPTKEQQLASLEGELASTDWYVVRFAETGVPVPDEITARRAELREQISTLRNKGE